jgi:hypothetical protein
MAHPHPNQPGDQPVAGAGFAAKCHEPATIKITSISELLAVFPYALGFQPTRSLCVLCQCAGNAEAAVMRTDLPDHADIDDHADQTANALVIRDVIVAGIAGFGPRDETAPVIDAVVRALGRAGIYVKAAVQADGTRYWCCLCNSEACCPHEGIVYDVATTVVAAQAVADGNAPFISRDQLAATLAPATGAARAAMDRAAELADSRLRAWLDDGLDDEAIRARMADEGIPLVRDVVARALDGGRLLDTEVAWLTLLLSHPRVRGEACARLGEDPDTMAALVGLWKDVLRRSDPSFAAAPAYLLACAAYLSGNGVLANLALDRADPDNPMAADLRTVIAGALPPGQA